LNSSEINTKNKIINNNKENLVIDFKEDFCSSSDAQRPAWACQYTQPSMLMLFDRTVQFDCKFVNNWFNLWGFVK
jgi:hypothetical protein